MRLYHFTLYHFTHPNYFPSIMRDGLVPSDLRRSDQSIDRACVWLFDTPETRDYMDDRYRCLIVRIELGLDWGGPCMVVTPKCLFDFDREAGRMKVRSIHPGVNRQELKDATAFDLGDLSSVPETEAPTAGELHILRHEVDPRGVLMPTL